MIISKINVKVGTPQLARRFVCRTGGKSGIHRKNIAIKQIIKKKIVKKFPNSLYCIGKYIVGIFFLRLLEELKKEGIPKNASPIPLIVSKNPSEVMNQKI